MNAICLVDKTIQRQTQITEEDSPKPELFRQVDVSSVNFCYVIHALLEENTEKWTKSLELPIELDKLSRI